MIPDAAWAKRISSASLLAYMPMRERNRACGRRQAQATSGIDGFLWGWVHLLSDHLNDTAGDLLMYAASLATDFSRDQRDCQAKAERGEWTGDGGSWAHGTLYDWFEAWGAWVGADSPRHAGLEPVTWRSIALQLSVARSYE
ncbi:hypothetical protein [Streptomyces chrestomyceticus]|uniref:hypothetical protein n=1 Tax=Streptomyces chrestomyceticus TaxID=68185 RepID=UPI0033EF8DBE